jgi:hypothetical protein
MDNSSVMLINRKDSIICETKTYDFNLAAISHAFLQHFNSALYSDNTLLLFSPVHRTKIPVPVVQASACMVKNGVHYIPGMVRSLYWQKSV